MNGQPHFEISKRTWTSFQECDALASDYVNQTAGFVKDIWAQCIALPGNPV
jgi:hypothetical protein